MKRKIFALMLALMLAITSILMISCGDEEPPIDESSSESSSSSSQPESNSYDGLSTWFGDIV